MGAVPTQSSIRYDRGVHKSKPDGRQYLRVLVVVASVVLALQFLMLFYGAWITGVGYDETYHIRLDWLQPYYAARDPLWFGIYGYSSQYLGHLLNVAFGTEQWLTLYDESPRGYAIRHEATALLGLIAIAAVALQAWMITRAAWVAVVGAAFLAAIPVWGGHAMMNPKDVPVAVGYTLVSAGMVSLTMIRWKKWSSFQLLLPMFVIAVGFFIVVGCRFGMMVPLLVTYLFFAALQFLIRGSFRSSLSVSLAGLVGIFGGMIMIVFANDYLIDNMSLELVRSMVFGSGAYPWQGTVRFDGSIYSGADLPREYWVIVLFLSTPLVIFGCFLFSIWLIARDWVGAARVRGLRLPKRVAALTLVAAQAVFLPTVATVMKIADYDSQRHHLYAFPAIAMLASFSVWWFWKAQFSFVSSKNSSDWKARRKWKIGWLFLTCAAMVIPTVEAVRLFPYNYVYMNPIASIEGVNGRWELDYWGLAMREAQRKIPLGAEFQSVGAFPNTFNVFSQEQGSDSKLPSLKSNQYFLTVVPRGSWSPQPACRKVGSVTRPLRGEKLDLAILMVCEESSRDQ
jgi:hypothetical protein